MKTVWSVSTTFGDGQERLNDCGDQTRSTDPKRPVDQRQRSMLNYLKNYLPWRRFPLLGAWKVDLTSTEQRLNDQLTDKSRIASELQSLSAERWVFTRTYSTLIRHVSADGEPTIESRHRYWWAERGVDRVYISGVRDDGYEILFSVDHLDKDRFEFFDPARGYAVVWRQVSHGATAPDPTRTFG